MTRRLAPIALPLIAALLAPACALAANVAAQPNPQARQRVDLNMRVEGAPGPFERVDCHADYRVENPACVPLTAVTGATVVPEQRVPVSFEPAAGGGYRAEILLDRFRDEDYYGKGICHWALVGVTADLHHGQVDFSPAIYLADIVAERDVVKHFSNKSYANADHARIDIGADSASAFNDPQATFRIRLHGAAR